MSPERIAEIFEQYLPFYECRISRDADGQLTLHFDSRVTTRTHFTIPGVQPELITSEPAVRALSRALGNEFALVRAGLRREPQVAVFGLHPAR